MQTKEVRFDIRYTGGEAEENKLDLYNASNSILGLSKALAISTHALVSKGEVRKNGATIPNVKLYLHPPKKGSFVESVSVFFENAAVQAIGISTISAAFWAMLEYSFKIATGQDCDVVNPTVKKIIREKDLIDLELADVLEKPLQQLHRPIKGGAGMNIEINRPRKGTVINFDSATKNYVFSTIQAGIKDDLVGNVTKYNIITGYGRFYDDELERTLPFNIDKDKISVEHELLIRWSLFNADFDDGGKICLTASVVNDKANNAKRYIVTGAKKIDDDYEAGEEAV
ncbi:MAG: hypothetical protein ACEPOZ_05920 [Marinifilaceae bacterium]